MQRTAAQCCYLNGTLRSWQKLVPQIDLKSAWLREVLLFSYGGHNQLKATQFHTMQLGFF